MSGPNPVGLMVGLWNDCHHCLEVVGEWEEVRGTLLYFLPSVGVNKPCTVHGLLVCRPGGVNSWTTVQGGVA